MHRFGIFGVVALSTAGSAALAQNIGGDGAQIVVRACEAVGNEGFDVFTYTVRYDGQIAAISPSGFSGRRDSGIDTLLAGGDVWRFGEAVGQILDDRGLREVGCIDLSDAVQSIVSAEWVRDAIATGELEWDVDESNVEITAMAAALEEQRHETEEILTMLVAAQDAEQDLGLRLASALANLADAEDQSHQGQRQIEALNQQVAALRRQLGQLQALLDAAHERELETEALIDNLGARLNAALAQLAAEQRSVRELEAQLLAEEAARQQE